MVPTTENGGPEENQELSEGFASSPNGKADEILITKTLGNLFCWLSPKGAFSLFSWFFPIFQMAEILQRTCLPQNLVKAPSDVRILGHEASPTNVT